ncbi:MAG: pectate lyase [Clostridiales bacterium]|nr:pectate lyase [Clostridiales bacterium]
MKRRVSLVICTMLVLNFIVFLFDNPTSVSAAYASYNWINATKKDNSWYSSSEAIKLADDIIRHQLSDGGWKKDMDGSASGSWGKSTIDNDATTSQIIILARVYKATNNSKYLNSCQRGIDLLIDGQYSNGGWPQVFNDPGTYHAHITYNDGAMIHVMNIMKDISQKSGHFSFIDSSRQSRAKTAYEKGIQCILNTQIVVNGVKCAWSQQHDEFTLKPAKGRAYEPAVNCTSESVGIVNFLKSIENPSTDIINSINAAVTWFTNVQINGIKVVSQNDDRFVVQDPNAAPIWARFYELETNKPIFGDRDGNIYYNMADISQERRTGYSWYGGWPSSLVKAGLLPLPDDNPIIIEPLTGTLIKALNIYDKGNYEFWSIQYNLQIGNNIYGDRDFTFTSIPKELNNAEYIKPSCDSKFSPNDIAEFIASEDITVYIGLDTRIQTIPPWLSGWISTGETATASNDVDYNIYKKNFKANDKVMLGTNGQSAGVVNYFVAVKSEEKIITNPIGDINEDGKINWDDYILLKKYLLGNIKELPNYELADIDGDNIISNSDLIYFKRSIFKLDS